MSTLTTETGREPVTSRRLRKACVIYGLFSACLLLLVAVISPDKTALFTLMLLGTAGGYLLWQNPPWTTWVVFFLLYTNLPVVAVNYHGAPSFFPALTIGLLLWPLAHRFLVEKKKIQISNAFCSILLFALVQLIGSLFSRYPTDSFDAFFSFLLEGLVLFLFVDNLIDDRKKVKKLLWTLAFSGLLMGGAPIIQQLSGNPNSEMSGLSQTDSEFKADNERSPSASYRQKRFSGTIGEQNRYAQFMVILLPICISVLVLSKSRLQRWVAAASVLCAGLGFALAFSRGAAVGLMFAVIIGSWAGYLSIRQIRWLVLVSILILLALPQYWTRLASISRLLDTRAAASNSSDGAIRGRLTEMGAAALVFRDHMMIGVGPGVFREYSKDYGQRIGIRSLKGRRQAHCMPLDIAAENGLLGLLAFSSMLWILLRDLNRGFRLGTTRGDPEAEHACGAISLSLILFLTTSLFLHMSYIRYFWFLMAIGSSVARVYRPRNEEQAVN